MHKEFLQEGFDQCLSHLIEECAEVIVSAAKIQRFGKESVNPLLPKEEQQPNLVRLIEELNDLKHAVQRIKKEINNV